MKKQKGVTLISLVITIIVLIILAGVSIAVLTGDNGILTHAQGAKEELRVKEAEEKLKLAIMAVRSGSKSETLDAEKLKEEIATNYGGEIEENDKGFPLKVIVNNITFVIDENGVITKKEIEEGIKSADIANDEDKNKYYGKIVKEYNLPTSTTTSVKWKIFYADENNIYLIADDYIELANVPNSTTSDGTPTNRKPNTGKFSKTAYFNNIMNDYADGSARITDRKIKKLNYSYFYKNEDGKEVNNFSSTNNNMKAVAYLLDTRAWNSKFIDVNGKAEYVIGGPTIEMLMKSYSQTHDKCNYEANATSADGYKISIDGGTKFENYYSGILDIANSLYVKERTDALAYWLASPSAFSTNSILRVDHSGGIDGSTYDSNARGFRPIICLKNETRLQKNEDDTFTIL